MISIVFLLLYFAFVSPSLAVTSVGFGHILTRKDRIVYTTNSRHLGIYRPLCMIYTG